MNSIIRKTGAIPELKGKSKPYVIAHRGNQTACPENTLAAFGRAIADGADIIETDLHLTQDDVFVCIHDPMVDRTTNGKGAVAHIIELCTLIYPQKYGKPDPNVRGMTGPPAQAGNSQAFQPVLLIDTLHRILWLVENEPRNLNAFLDAVRPDRERLRLVDQALAGTALEGGSARVLEGERVGGYTTPKEHAALQKLLANWKSLIEKGIMPLFQRQEA